MLFLLTPSDRKTIVLVHGSSAGGWCYRAVADLLEQRGHKVYSPTLTGLGERSHLMSGLITLNTHITDIVNAGVDVATLGGVAVTDTAVG